MLGFLIGAGCLIGLVKVLKHHHYSRCGGWHGSHHDWRGPGGCPARHHGWHHGGWHHHHHHQGWRGWHGPRGRHGSGPGLGPWARGRGPTTWWLYPLFSRLDTTPGQEKVIRREAEALRATLEEGRGELFSSRGDIATALRGASLDETALGELFARHDERLRAFREQLVGSLARVHDALDEQQRERLAGLIESGPRGYPGGPYRGEG